MAERENVGWRGKKATMCVRCEWWKKISVQKRFGLLLLLPDASTVLAFIIIMDAPESRELLIGVLQFNREKNSPFLLTNKFKKIRYGSRKKEQHPPLVGRARFFLIQLKCNVVMKLLAG
jgi:hypothetical protein